MRKERRTGHHWSDCAVNNGPALTPGPCDCGATKAARRWWTWFYHLAHIRVAHWKIYLQARIAHVFCRL